MKNKDKDGFTLLEVMISLGLLMMITGLLPLVTVIQNSNTYSSSSVSMTNIALTLSESLANLDFTILGSDAPGSCRDITGYVVNGTANNVCAEGPLNQVGYTNLDNSSSDNVYMYYRYSTICSSAGNLPGGYTGTVCDMPSANYVGGPVINELNCTASNYTSTSKEIKVVVAYRDKRGKCKKTSLSAWKATLE